MRRKASIIPILSCFILLLLLITKTDTATRGALEGIELCYKVLIPSLFPFFLIITYTSSLLNGLEFSGRKLLRNVMKLPAGAESILFLGLLGGYPVGAQLIAENYHNGQINRETSHILLGYCCNAGPAFIFGITRLLFSNPFTPFILWFIHILSAIITACILPKPPQTECHKVSVRKMTLAETMHTSLQICACVCGWVIVFKIIQAYLSTWVNAVSNSITKFLLFGILELSNGCIFLLDLNNEVMRFILISGFLGFGGLCVLLQVISVTDQLGLGSYIPGKLIQSGFSVMLATFIVLPHLEASTLFTILIIAILLILIPVYVNKKHVVFQMKIMYNPITNN